MGHIRTITVALIAAVAAGCAADTMTLDGHGPGESLAAETYPDEFDAAVQAWGEHLLIGANCGERTLYVVHERESDYARCGAGGREGGCTLWRSSALWDDYWLIVVSDESNASEVVRRETGVWLLLCSGGADRKPQQ